ncbi:MAG: hypothetical protein LBL49_10895 [Clostridiales Family XIII bacterium]|jgi:hypothetical protein|nr:hypothetical protein [Clostridiales Family XIII bacterium]
MAGNKYPIIAHGELYIEPITKKGGGGVKKIPHEYAAAKQKIIADIDRIFDVIQEKREIFLEEKIVCVRMEPKFEAKSYVPTQLLTDESMSIVGGRKYTFVDDTLEEQTAKLYFIKTDNNGIRKIKETLSIGVKDNVDAWCDQVGSIHSMDLLLLFSPKINAVKGMVNISWTIASIVAPYVNDPDAYTNNCIEDVFIPHDMTFNFYKKDRRTKKIVSTKKLNLFKPDDVIKAKALIDEGYYRSDFPASHPTKHSWDESELRATDFKWDTVIKKMQRMRGSSLLNPALTLHAIDRNGFDAKHIQYYAAITIEAPKYVGSLYDTILQTYQNLTPIEIRNVNRIMVDYKSDYDRAD